MSEADALKHGFAAPTLANLQNAIVNEAAARSGSFDPRELSEADIAAIGRMMVRDDAIAWDMIAMGAQVRLKEKQSCG